MAAAATATATASPIRRPPRNVRIICFSPMSGGMSRLGRWPPRLQFRFLPHDDLGAHGDTVIEVGDVGIDQPEATGRDGGTDRIRTVGAVDAVDGGAEVARARTEAGAGAP